MTGAALRWLSKVFEGPRKETSTESASRLLAPALRRPFDSSCRALYSELYYTAWFSNRGGRDGAVGIGFLSWGNQGGFYGLLERPDKESFTDLTR